MRSEFEALQGQTPPNTCCRPEQTTDKRNESAERKRATLVRSNSEPGLACEKWSSAIREFSALQTNHDDRSLLRSSSRPPCTPASTSSTVQRRHTVDRFHIELAGGEQITDSGNAGEMSGTSGTDAAHVDDTSCKDRAVIATEKPEELSPRNCSPPRPTAVLARSSSEPNLQELQSPIQSVIDQNFFKSLAKRIKAERQASLHDEPR